jgi:PIN domain nuclease of toxin-antitoxin system
MRLLLDTHSFLWFIGGSERISEKARALIEDASNRSFISIASLWEMAIKLSIGKLSLAQPLDVLIPKQMWLNGFDLLEIEINHLETVADLPFHHRDPFDRLLIAQAMVEHMPIVSADVEFDAYPVERLW